MLHTWVHTTPWEDPEQAITYGNPVGHRMNTVLALTAFTLGGVILGAWVRSMYGTSSADHLVNRQQREIRRLQTELKLQQLKSQQQRDS